MSLRVPRRRSTEVILRLGPITIERHHVSVEDEPEHQAFTMALADWVSVVAVTEDGQFLLVRQHRHGVDAVTIEPVGGIVDEGEDPAATALRELVEETGYSGGSIELLGWVHPNPAIQSNKSYLFLVRDARPAPQAVTDQHGNDEHESTEPVLMTREEVVRALKHEGDVCISHALGALALERALARIG